MIQNKDKDKAEKILEHFGYRKANTAYSKIHRLLKDKPTESAYYKVVNDIPVVFDIHFEVFSLMHQLGKLDSLYGQSLINRMTNQFLAEKRVIMVQKINFPILSPANLIIYLSLHFFHHNYRGWHMVNFLSKVVKHSLSKNTDILREIKNKILFYRLHNFVYPVFIILKKYYNCKLPESFLESIKPDNKRLRYIKENILTINIFDGESRIKAGITRVKNLFILSPYPLLLRLLIVFNPQVIYSAFWVITLWMRRSLIIAFKSP